MNSLPITDIESQIKDIQERKRKAQADDDKSKGIGLLDAGYFDSDIYDGNGAQGKQKYEGYVTSIATNEDEDEDDDEPVRASEKRTTGMGAPLAFFADIARVSQIIISINDVKSNEEIVLLQTEPEYDPFADRRPKTVGEKEDEYRQKRRKLVISPERVDPFADGKFLSLILISINPSI